MTGQTKSNTFKKLETHIHKVKAELSPEELAIVKACGV
jgi:hypothetical protein